MHPKSDADWHPPHALPCLADTLLCVPASIKLHDRGHDPRRIKRRRSNTPQNTAVLKIVELECRVCYSVLL
ncbi:uncharacterized protein FTOL_10989 [Fusarium torulosum]|uniref:Uncharacterized protein n=1 Tax=Fusarium torulosum TaxID=33205 RepID=A0AAE8MJ96_9HYPO|nr:uncharacterized protein FTOL_10989 [Fusarium torulosum]